MPQINVSTFYLVNLLLKLKYILMCTRYFIAFGQKKKSKIYKISKFLLEKNNSEKSKTWSRYFIYLSELYGTDTPLLCLEQTPPDRDTIKNYYKTKIIQFHEKEQRQLAKSNSSMKYLNVDLLGLSGKIHPIISNIYTSKEVETAIPHIKMLCLNYYTCELKSKYKGGSDKCPRCIDYKTDNIQHILTSHISEKGYNILLDIEEICTRSDSQLSLNKIYQNEEDFCQFILDPTSMNLTSRISFDDSYLSIIIKKCRDYCFIIDKERKIALDLMR